MVISAENYNNMDSSHIPIIDRYDYERMRSLINNANNGCYANWRLKVASNRCKDHCQESRHLNGKKVAKMDDKNISNIQNCDHPSNPAIPGGLSGGGLRVIDRNIMCDDMQEILCERHHAHDEPRNPVPWSLIKRNEDRNCRTDRSNKDRPQSCYYLNNVNVDPQLYNVKYISAEDPIDGSLANRVALEKRCYQYVHDKSSQTSYIKGKLLGKGGFAKCFKFTEVTTNINFAAKMICKSQLVKISHKEQVKREIEIHRPLFHPNIVHLQSHFEDDFYMYIILEYCDNKTLVDLIKDNGTLSEEETRFFMKQILGAVLYLHNIKILHRDLKLGNMFLTKRFILKVGDFGLSSKLEETNKKVSICGTPNYIAPEILSKTGHSFPADIWAIGCIMFAMLSGKPPFESESLRETYHRISKNIYKIPHHLSPEAKDLIAKFLIAQPHLRIDLCAAIDHPYFMENLHERRHLLEKSKASVHSPLQNAKKHSAPEMISCVLVKKRTPTNKISHLKRYSLACPASNQSTHVNELGQRHLLDISIDFKDSDKLDPNQGKPIKRPARPVSTIFMGDNQINKNRGKNDVVNNDNQYIDNSNPHPYPLKKLFKPFEPKRIKGKFMRWVDKVKTFKSNAETDLIKSAKPQKSASYRVFLANETSGQDIRSRSRSILIPQQVKTSIEPSLGLNIKKRFSCVLNGDKYLFNNDKTDFKSTLGGFHDLDHDAGPSQNEEFHAENDYDAIFSKIAIKNKRIGNGRKPLYFASKESITGNHRPAKKAQSLIKLTDKISSDLSSSPLPSSFEEKLCYDRLKCGARRACNNKEDSGNSSSGIECHSPSSGSNSQKDKLAEILLVSHEDNVDKYPPFNRDSKKKGNVMETRKEVLSVLAKKRNSESEAARILNRLRSSVEKLIDQCERSILEMNRLSCSSYLNSKTFDAQIKESCNKQSHDISFENILDVSLCNKLNKNAQLIDSPFVWVTKWVDYAEKYGFGYQLSNGSQGVLFKDDERIYVEGQRLSLYDNSNVLRLAMPLNDAIKVGQASNINHAKNQFANKAHDKLCIYSHFASFMERNLIDGMDYVALKSSMTDESSRFVTLKKFSGIQNRSHGHKNRERYQTLLMRLNDGTTQINFLNDHVKIIFGVNKYETNPLAHPSHSLYRTWAIFIDLNRNHYAFDNLDAIKILKKIGSKPRDRSNTLNSLVCLKGKLEVALFELKEEITARQETK
ncbi:unnamed protein product [Gordionus sp. m RMFG-2023]|uniref:uncharacterized protein LOC135927044 n=1 Tax=Gordionus sp. m RMFG-2023 TaxID=3053472 RepID=UPI0030E22F8E